MSYGQGLWPGGVSPPSATVLGAPCAEDEMLDLPFFGVSCTSYRQELGTARPSRAVGARLGPGLALTGSLGLIPWEVAPASWHSEVQLVPKHGVGTFS